MLGAACIAFAGFGQETIEPEIISQEIDPEATRRAFFYAVLIAAALLFVLNRVRERFSMDALRVLADVALIAPFPVFWVMTIAR